MNRLRVFLSRLGGLLRKPSMERDLDEELDFHLQMETAENLRRGMTAEKARTAALRRFGGVTQVKEIYRDTHALSALQLAYQDTRFALRVLRRSPGFSILAILLLVLGIGATTAVFGWIEGILLRPFPLVAGQERLMSVVATTHGAIENPDVAWPDFLDFQRRCTLFDAFIGDRITGTTLSTGDHAQRATGSVVSTNYFDALGVHLLMGRGFRPEESAGRSAHPLTVISYRLWKDRLNSDPNIVGKSQMLNGLPHTIIGVAPEGFYGTFVGWGMQFWVPSSMEERFVPTGYKLEDRDARWVEGFVKLKPGVSAEQAQAEISAVASRLEAEYPETNRGRGVKLFPLWRTPFNNAGTLLPTLQIALVVVVFLLLIVCANVSNLLLVKAFNRRQEMTIRIAVGAGRGRLVKQLLTEALILASLATAGGLLAARWCQNLLVVLLPRRAGVSMTLPGQIDWRVLLLSAGVCLLTTLLFGLLPVMQTGKIDLASALKTESSGVMGGQGRAVVRSGFVLVQVALSFVLLVGTFLLVESLRTIRNTDPGFSTSNVLTTWVDLVSVGYDPQRAKGFRDALAGRLQALPGVQSAAFVRGVPFSYGGYSSAPIAVDGGQSDFDARNGRPTVSYDEVDSGYLATMGIPLVSGREFTRADDENAPPVAVVNETMAAQYWRGQDAVGRNIQVKDRWMRVVGVARTSKYQSLREAPKPFFYVPMRQSAAGSNLVIRTSLPIETMGRALLSEIHALDSNLAPGELITMREQVDRTTSAQRVAANFLSMFGGLALLLAAIGLYGTMSYTVSQRTRELGLRMALGAGGSQLLRVVMLQGLMLTAAGMALGAGVALGIAPLLGYLLYQVSPREPRAYLVALVVMAGTSVLACFVPAWRATRIDPLRALKS